MGTQLLVFLQSYLFLNYYSYLIKYDDRGCINFNILIYYDLTDESNSFMIWCTVTWPSYGQRDNEVIIELKKTTYTIYVSQVCNASEIRHVLFYVKLNSLHVVSPLDLILNSYWHWNHSGVKYLLILDIVFLIVWINSVIRHVFLPSFM